MIIIENCQSKLRHSLLLKTPQYIHRALHGQSRRWGLSSLICPKSNSSDYLPPAKLPPLLALWVWNTSGEIIVLVSPPDCCNSSETTPPSKHWTGPPETPVLQPPEHFLRFLRGALFTQAVSPPVMPLMLSSPSSPRHLPKFCSLYSLAWPW